MIFRQTAAIFLDAYRELNSKKLFWITMAISGLVVLAFAAVGINQKGLSVLGWDIEIGVLNSTILPPEMFYKQMFLGLGIKFWLTWIATILALVSTAGLIPDFIASGSIELTLSRPIGRVRLFLTKFAAGLLFVTLQVGMFTLLSFLVIGLRGGSWEVGLFWAVPLTVVFFSYLFSICVLLGLLTRSTIASLLLTLLIWFGIFGLNTVESIFMGLRIGNEMVQEQANKNIKQLEEQRAKGLLAPKEGEVEPQRLVKVRDRLKEAEENGGWLVLAHSAMVGIKTALPKTTETVNLLERTLVSQADLDALGGPDDDDRPPPPFMGDNTVRINMREYTDRVTKATRDRPVWWIVGTSLVFELVVLGAACRIFVRRDF